jgi:alpha-D-xyloside xylohydrolase
VFFSQVPWLIDSTGEADAVLKHFVSTKHSLMPYLYAQAIHTHRTGEPMLRATFLEYPDDPSTWYLDTQYFLGSSLLVAPIFSEDGEVTYYVPKGEWYGLLDGKIRTGPGYVTETHDFFSLPVLVRPGAVVAQGSVVEKVVYDWTADVTLVVNWVEGMETRVEIADSEKLGEIKATFVVKSSGKKVTVNLVSGTVTGEFKVKVANKKIAKKDVGAEVVGENVVKVAKGVKEVEFELE